MGEERGRAAAAEGFEAGSPDPDSIFEASRLGAGSSPNVRESSKLAKSSSVSEYSQSQCSAAESSSVSEYSQSQCSAAESSSVSEYSPSQCSAAESSSVSDYSPSQCSAAESSSVSEYSQSQCSAAESSSVSEYSQSQCKSTCVSAANKQQLPTGEYKSSLDTGNIPHQPEENSEDLIETGNIPHQPEENSEDLIESADDDFLCRTKHQRKWRTEEEFLKTPATKCSYNLRNGRKTVKLEMASKSSTFTGRTCSRPPPRKVTRKRFQRVEEIILTSDSDSEYEPSNSENSSSTYASDMSESENINSGHSSHVRNSNIRRSLRLKNKSESFYHK
jgi:hypothetical protein